MAHALFLSLLLLCLHAQNSSASEVLLSPLLRSGKAAEAKEASKVEGAIFGGHAGYISTDSQDLDRIWFWLHDAKVPTSDTCVPLILWMQGGPGVTGQVGALNEMGPYYLDTPNTTASRNLTWNNKYAMVFVDQPVESGYSYTKREPIEYVQTSDEAAAKMYTFLLQFFDAFPEYKCSPFYIMGESYGGHYVPHTSYHIHAKNLALQPSDPAYINLKGGSRRPLSFKRTPSFAFVRSHLLVLSPSRTHSPPRLARYFYSILIPLSSGLAIGNPDLDMASQMPPIADMLFNFGLVDEKVGAIQMCIN
jgi:hypothetical protein